MGLFDDVLASGSGKTIKSGLFDDVLGEKPARATALDYLKGAAAGSNQLLSGIGYLAEKAGADNVGRALREQGDSGSQFWHDKMTAGGKTATQSQVFEKDTDPDAIIPYKTGDKWGQALFMGAAESAPSMLAGAGPGALVTKGLQTAAKGALSAGVGAGGATMPLVAGIAAPVSGIGAKVAARAPSAIGMGVGEGGVAASMNSAQERSKTENTPFEQLEKSPEFVALKEQYGQEKARLMLAEKTASDVFLPTLAWTGGVGALTGGGALGRMMMKQAAPEGIIKGTLKGARDEAIQEFAQSGGETYIQNLAEQRHLDPSINPWEGVGESALSGAAIGGLLGGAFGSAGSIGGSKQQQQREDQQPSPLPQTEPSLLGAVPQAVDQDMVATEPVQAELYQYKNIAGLTPETAYDWQKAEQARTVEQAKSQLGDGVLGRSAAAGIDSGAVHPLQIIPEAAGAYASNSPAPFAMEGELLARDFPAVLTEPRQPNTYDQEQGKLPLFRDGLPFSGDPAIIETARASNNMVAFVQALGAQGHDVKSVIGNEDWLAELGRQYQQARALPAATLSKVSANKEQQNGQPTEPISIQQTRKHNEEQDNEPPMQSMRDGIAAGAAAIATDQGAEQAQTYPTGDVQVSIKNQQADGVLDQHIAQPTDTSPDAITNPATVQPESPAPGADIQPMAQPVAPEVSKQSASGATTPLPQVSTGTQGKSRSAEPRFISRRNPGGGSTTHAVEDYQDVTLDELPGHAFFTHIGDDGQTVLTHADTGMRFATGDSAKQAIKKAKDLIAERGVANINKVVESATRITDEDRAWAMNEFTARKQETPESTTPEADAKKPAAQDGWRANIFKARKYANELGVPHAGERLAGLTAKIEAHLAGNTQKPAANLTQDENTPSVDAQPRKEAGREAIAKRLADELAKKANVHPADFNQQSTDIPTADKIRLTQDVQNGDIKPEAVAAIVGDVSTNPEKVNTSDKSVQKTAKSEQVETPLDVKAISAAEGATNLSVGAQTFLERFQSGDFTLPNIYANPTGSVKERAAKKKVAEQAMEQQNRDYAQAAKAFIEGDLTAKVPNKNSPHLNIQDVENATPRGIPKNVKKVKRTLADYLKAVYVIAAKDDVRYYINGAHIEPENGRIVVTDGHRVAVVEDAPMDGLPIKTPDEQENATVLGRDGHWIKGKFVPYDRVIQTEHTSEPVVVSAKALGDYARGVTRVGKYISSVSFNTPIPLSVGGVSAYFEARYVAEMTDLFRAMGYDNFTISISDKNVSMYAESEDRKLRHKIMAIRSDSLVVSPVVDGVLPGNRNIDANTDGAGGVAKEAKSEQVDAAQEGKSVEAKSNTEDSGAELTYNKRNRLTRGIKWEDVADKNEVLRVKEVIKTKVIPKPDYDALIASFDHGDETLNKLAAHLIKQVYDSISAKPKAATPTDEQLQTYIVGANRVMDGAMAWAGDKDRIVELLKKMSTANRYASVLGIATSSPKSLLDMVYPDGYKANLPEIRLIGGNKVLGALQPGANEAVKAMKEIGKGWPVSQESWQKQGLTVISGADLTLKLYEGNSYGSRFVKFYIHNTERNSIEQTTIEGATSKDDAAVQQAANARLAELKDKYLVLGKSNRLVAVADTEESAIEKARELVKRESKTDQISEKGWSVEAAKRVGDAHRMEGEDISSDRLKETFGFKGVNFGNWMKGESKSKSVERQAHLNHAYDAFLDLAEIVGVPPKAMSLNGMLGIAIGAQGSGKALAHFVPGVNEINLTRTGGAGALAHEWAHALDHYFATLAGLGRKKEPYLTEHADVIQHEVVMENGRQISREVDYPETLRPEVLAQFKAIVQAMTKKMSVPPTEQEMKESNDRMIAREEKRVQSWIRSVRHDFESPYFAPGRSTELNNAAKDVLIKAFDALVERINKMELGDGKVQASSTKAIYPVIAEMREAYKKATGRTYDLDQAYGLHTAISYLKHSKESGMSTMLHVPQLVTSDYMSASISADKKKNQKYWATRLEMFARAFDAYVVDTLAEKSAENTYLAGIEAVPPTGDERKAINKAFDALIGELKTKETDQGTALFSRNKQATYNKTANPHTETTLTRAIDAAFGKGFTDRLKWTGKFRFAASDSLGAGIGGAKFSQTETIEKSGSKPNDPIVVNGSIDIVLIPEEVVARTKGKFLSKPVRVMNGRHFGKNRGFGVAHIEAEHGKEIEGEVTRYVVSLLRNATKIYDDGAGRLIVHSPGLPRGAAFIELRDEGDFYSVVTAYDAMPRGKLVWSGRRLHLSSKGSGDAEGSATATTGQSVSPSAMTARGNDSIESPNPVLEALADQTSGNHDAPEMKFSQDGRILAYVQNGVTTFVTDNISQTADNVKGLVLHEVGSHAMQLGKTDAEFQKIIKHFKLMAKTGNKQAQAAQARVPKDTAAAHVDEEALSYYLETNPDLPFSKRIIAAFRDIIRKLGKNLPALERMKWVKWANDLTTDDIVYMATQAVRSAPDTLNKAAAREGMFKSGDKHNQFDGQRVTDDDRVFASLNREEDGSLTNSDGVTLTPAGKTAMGNIAYRIKDGDEKGTIGAIVVKEKDGKIVELLNIKIDKSKRNKGIGSRVVKSIIASSNGDVDITDIVNGHDGQDDSRGFWKYMGTRWVNYSGDATQMDGKLSWRDYANAENERNVQARGRSRAGADDSKDQQGVGSEGEIEGAGNEAPTTEGYEVGEVSPEDLKGIKFSRRGNAQNSAFNIPDETSSEKFRRHWQDAITRWKTVQDAIKAQGGTVSVYEDVEAAMKRYPGRVGEMITNFTRDTVEPLLKRMASLKTDMEDIGTYLYALHAADRNAYIQTIRDDMPDSGSGMTNEEASAIIAEFQSRQDFKEFDKLARDFQALTSKKLDMLVNGGVITQDQRNAMDAAMGDFYVPLKGFETIDEEGNRGNGSGITYTLSPSPILEKRDQCKKSYFRQKIEHSTF